ncbi:MAG: tail fiber domain-containing protein [Bacteroidota bacterium]
MRLKVLFTLILAVAIQGMTFAQFVPLGATTDIVNVNTGNVLIDNGPALFAPTFAKLDVRGDNIILADPATGNFPTRFLGLGVAGGGSPNACPGYGMRIQPNTDNQMSLFMLSDRIPVLQFGPRDFFFLYKQDPLAPGCGQRIIGITPNSSHLFVVAGSILATAFTVSSDRRLKRDFTTIQSPLEKILATNGQKYFYRTDLEDDFSVQNMPETEQVGYIAQELQEILPQAVTEGDNGYLSVNYNMLVPVITEAMKEQQDIIDQQKAQITQLEDRLGRIEALLNAQGKLDLGSDNIQLKQNRPNPFGKNTTIDYALPNDFNNANIRIIDAAGKEVRNYSITDAAGQLEVDGQDLTSGIYYYTLIVDGQAVRTEKMVVR